MARRLQQIRIWKLTAGKETGKTASSVVRTGNLRMRRTWACDVYDTQQYVERAISCTHIRRVMQPVIKANSEAMVRDC